MVKNTRCPLTFTKRIGVLWVALVVALVAAGVSADTPPVAVASEVGETTEEAEKKEEVFVPIPAPFDGIDPAINPDYAYYEWPDNPPADCPFEESKDIDRIVFTGRYANYSYSDTWYFTWAKDDNNYSCWTDGAGIPEYPGAMPYGCCSGFPRQAPWSTGQCKIIGDSPLNLEFINLGKMYSDRWYYPCVSVVANGVYYIGTYEAFHNQPGNCFDGFRYSRDWDHFTEEHEDHWTNPYWIDATDDPEKNGFDNPSGIKNPDGSSGLLAHNFFDEKEKAKFRVPHAVNFGQDNELSPDDKIYLTAHGYDGGNGMNQWDKGDAIYLCRVDAKPEKVTSPRAYEFFAGHTEKGKAIWSKKVEESKPILSWPNHLGSEGMTYIPGLKKYILMACRLTEVEENLDYNVFTIWESDHITGPFKLVHYLRDWGPQTYFPNIPSKFVSKDGKSAWVVATSNYRIDKPANPIQCRAACTMHELRFMKPGEEVPTPPAVGNNIAPQAKIEVISTFDGYSKEALVDGEIGGFPEDPSKEWASFKCRQDGWVRLTWDHPVRIDKIRLYDRPIKDERILGARIQFSDGSTEYLRCWLSDAAKAPGEVSFAPKEITWLKVNLNKVTHKTLNVGLAEIEVYEAN